MRPLTSFQGRLKKIILILFSAAVLVLFFSCTCRFIRIRVCTDPGVVSSEENRLVTDSSLGGKIRNSEQMIAQIREGLRSHSAGITISFDYGSDIFPKLNGVIEEWMEAAQQETDSPEEGDYIRWQLGGYSYKSTSEQRGDRWFYSVRIEPSYYTFLAQEEEVTKEVRRIRHSLHFLPWTSREEKIRRIYDYLCRNVKYDKVHRKNPHYHMRSTAYAALIRGTATCQGYCTALYRLLREENIPCRIVTGTAGQEDLHAWVIVEEKGLWYLLDPTWDAGQDTWQYFMRGTQDLSEDPESGLPAAHRPGDLFTTEAFVSGHPMAAHGLQTTK